MQTWWDRTVDNAARDGIRVTLVNHGGDSAGRVRPCEAPGQFVTRPGARQAPPERHAVRWDVEVNQNHAPVDRYATLVHELAHLYCGHQQRASVNPWPSRPRGTKARREIEAEAVAHLVMSRLDPNVRAGDYLLQHVQDDADVPADVDLTLVFKAATDILEMGQKRLRRRGSSPG